MSRPVRSQAQSDTHQPAHADGFEDAVKVEPVGEFELKGIRRPIAAYNVPAVATANPWSLSLSDVEPQQ